MNIFRIAAIALIASVLAANAQALQIDDRTNTNADGSAKLADPDDNVPYAHFDDNGTLQSSPLQMDLSGGSNAPLFSTGPATQSSDAFNRAQDNQK